MTVGSCRESVVESQGAQSHRPAGHQHQQDAKHPQVVTHQCHQAEETKDDERHQAIYLGKSPGRKSGGLHVDDVHDKVLFHIAQDGDKQVGHKEQE